MLRLNKDELKDLGISVLDKIGKEIVTRAKEKCPVNDGHLKSNITWDIKGDIVYVHTNNVPYADQMEYGRPPNIKLSESEKADIDKWALKHGLKSGKGVAISIEKRGIPVGANRTTSDAHRINTSAVNNPLHVTSLGRNSYRPFLRPAINEASVDLNAWLKSAI